ncbi:PASTA domain-containing protein [Oscillospiraceae bacterium MB08-C2-2]|nr:PASTA domain-containing protein [Oscillospiraceae bacterium MB08-C2-2]
MNKSDTSLCMGCMNPLREDGSCGFCEYQGDHAFHNPDYLPPGTSLQDRYLLGRVDRYNGEGATYIGYDRLRKSRVWIREYFPTTLAGRRADTGFLEPLPGMGAQCKALMSDFQDLCNEVRRLSISDAVIPILDAFCANNTVYAIYEDLGVQSLEDYLIDHGGKLSLEETQKLMMPLLNTVDNIHAQGSLHRGLSPYTIYIDEAGRLYLWDFALAATRTAKSELSAELFNGYSAPEQYSANGWQGSWTDVYALGALLYRVLTGFVPPKSIMRSPDRPLATLAELTDVPQAISDAVQKAMELSTNQRTQVVGSVAGQLLQRESDSTMVYDNLAREKKELARIRAQERAEKHRLTLRNILYVALALVVTVLFLFGAVWYYVTHYGADAIRGNHSSSSAESSLWEEESGAAVPDNAVPLFVGKKLVDIQSNQAYQERFDFVIKEEFNDIYEAGIVVSQSPTEGTAMVNRGNVTLVVSKGKEELEVPALVGKTRSEAMVILTELGIQFEFLEKAEPSISPDTVITTLPEEGTKIDLKRDKVILMITPAADSSSKSTPAQEASSSRPPSFFDSLDLDDDE